MPASRSELPEPLAAVGERGVHHLRQPRPVRPGGDRGAPLERDQRRVDPRHRREHVARHRAHRQPRAGQLHQHGDGAVGLAGGSGEQPVGDLALHHHAEPLTHRQGVHDHRRRHAVGQVGDHRRGRRLAAHAKSTRMASANSSRTLSTPSSVIASAGCSRRSISIACTSRVRSASQRVSTPRPGPTSSTTSSSPQRRNRADHAQHVVVDQEVLAEVAVGRDAELSQPGDGDLLAHGRIMPAPPSPPRPPPPRHPARCAGRAAATPAPRPAAAPPRCSTRAPPRPMRQGPRCSAASTSA